MVPSRSRAARDDVPKQVAVLLDSLVAGGHRCYIVGGAARALASGTTPGDWDVATSALPVDVKALKAAFPDLSLVEKGEEHGTVGVRDGGLTIEFTTLRAEGPYSDLRRPDSVTFIDDIRLDLERRDFTVNAFALEWPSLRVIDPFGGLRDLNRGVLRAVGEPRDRFTEDALRLMRAVRFVAECGWRLEARTRGAIPGCAVLLRHISVERVRDELARLLLGEHASRGLEEMVELGLMPHAIPEFEPSIGYRSGGRPGETLDQHAISVASLVRPDLSVRLAALLHDIGKPAAAVPGEGGERYPRHDSVGAEIAVRALERLRYPRPVRMKVQALVREHMFFYGAGVTDAAIRRLVRRVGEDNVTDLLELRKADATASVFGAKAVLSTLRRGRRGLGAAFMVALGDRAVAHVAARVSEVMNAGPVASGRVLAVDGHDVMEILGIGPGPAVGEVLRRLTDLVTEDPSLNDRERLRALIPGLYPLQRRPQD